MKAKTNPHRDAVVAMVGAGKSDREIREALGLTKNQVIGLRARLGIRSNVDPESSRSVGRQREIAAGKCGAPVPTLIDRMSALEARMNAVLAEYADRPAYHAKLPAATGRVFMFEGRK